MNKSKLCWEQFSTPTVRKGNNDMEILEFECPNTHQAFSVYYSKTEKICVDVLAKVMNSALSSCFRCTQLKLHCRNVGNV